MLKLRNGIGKKGVVNFKKPHSNTSLTFHRLRRNPPPQHIRALPNFLPGGFYFSLPTRDAAPTAAACPSSIFPPRKLVFLPDRGGSPVSPQAPFPPRPAAGAGAGGARPRRALRPPPPRCIRRRGGRGPRSAPPRSAPRRPAPPPEVRAGHGGDSGWWAPRPRAARPLITAGFKFFFWL